MEYLYIILLTALSIFAIGKGSDWFTESLVPVARKLSVSRISVALVLVSAAVSLPEILVAVTGAVKGYPLISLGVVFGSIICNIGLMVGISALVNPLKVTTKTILRDGIFSIVVPILVLAVSMDGKIPRVEGLAFFLLFIPYLINVYLLEKQIPIEQKEESLRDIEIELQLLGFNFGKLKAGWASFTLGLVLLLGGAQIFTDQLIAISQKFHFNDIVIGLTVGAIGTSIPNIAAAYKATKKKMEEVAISETLGSNIFTLLVTLGILAMISPITVSARWLYFDIPAMILMSILLFIFMLSKKTISRTEGLILLFAYLAILVSQIIFFK